jgi:hypothetical protein
MKTILTCLLTLGLASINIAAETPAKKKTAAKAEASSDSPSGKAQALTKSLTPSQRTKLLDLINTGDDKALQALPGIGETRAAAIKKARPFKDPVDLVNVDGIGDQSFAEIIAQAKAGGSESASETTKEKKGSKKKAPGKAKAGTKKKSDETPAEKSKEK